MTSDNLTDIFTLFVQGMIYGIPLSFIPFALGYFVQSVYSIIKHS